MVISEGHDFIQLNSTNQLEHFLAREGHSQIDFYLSPNCQYSIFVRLSVGDVVERLSNLFLPRVVPSHLLVIILLLNSETFSHSHHSSPLTALLSLSPISWILLSRLTVHSLNLLQLSSDADSLQVQGLNFGLVPLISFLVGSGLALLVTSSVWSLIRVTALLLSTVSPGPGLVSSPKVTVAVCAGLVLLSLLSSGALSLLIGGLLYVLHCSRLCQRPDDQPGPLNINVGLALLWISVTALNSPSLMVWLREGRQASDPSLIHSLCLLGSASILWQQSPARFSLQQRSARAVSLAFMTASILVSVFATLSVYRASFVVSGLFVMLASLSILNMDWTVSEGEQEEREEVPRARARGKLKIMRSYLETGEGVEGLDWELCMTEEGDSAILQYPYYVCVTNRLATLPADFIGDMKEVASIAFGFLCLTIENLWAQPRNPNIEVTVATPDFEYLPDNHPLRKLHLHTSNSNDTQLSKIEGFLENVKKICWIIYNFHYTFYHDLFLVGKMGFGFIFYLLTSFPLSLLKKLAGQTQEADADGQTVNPVTIVTGAFSGVLTIITKIVDDVGVFVLNYTQKRSESKQSSQSPAPSASGSASTSASAKFKPVRSVETPQIRLPQKKEPVKKPPQTPVKSMEAFKNEVKNQEEILKIGKEKVKELFSGPAIVSGPWIPEKIVPGYREDNQEDLERNSDIEEPRETVTREKKKENDKPTTFDAPIPASSVFERSSTSSDFDIKSKIRIPGWDDPKEPVRTNVHGSMYDIHAACEEEADDEHIEELEKLREISPSPELQTKFYRRTDIVGGDTSLLSQAPPESPDIKTRYSVKDEIAQLR